MAVSQSLIETLYVGKVLTVRISSNGDRSTAGSGTCKANSVPLNPGDNQATANQLRSKCFLLSLMSVVVAQKQASILSHYQ